MGLRTKKSIKRRATAHRSRVKANSKLRIKTRSRGRRPVGKKRKARAARRVGRGVRRG